MTVFHAPRLVTSVEEVLPKHPERMASVGGAPGHMVFHGNELPHRNSTPNRTRQLLSWPDGLSLLPDPFPQQARPEAEARGGEVGVGLGGSVRAANGTIEPKIMSHGFGCRASCEGAPYLNPYGTLRRTPFGCPMGTIRPNRQRGWRRRRFR